jgi:hypothetical protein
MPAKTKRKPKKKQVQLPGIRVSNPAWALGKRIKGLYSLVGKRVTQGQIYSEMMMRNGPALVKKLDKEYEDLKKLDKKLLME